MQYFCSISQMRRFGNFDWQISAGRVSVPECLDVFVLAVLAEAQWPPWINAGKTQWSRLSVLLSRDAVSAVGTLQNALRCCVKCWLSSVRHVLVPGHQVTHCTGPCGLGYFAAQPWRLGPTCNRRAAESASPATANSRIPAAFSIMFFVAPIFALGLFVGVVCSIVCSLTNFQGRRPPADSDQAHKAVLVQPPPYTETYTEPQPPPYCPDKKSR